MKLADGIFFHEEADHTGFLFSFEDVSSLMLNRMGVFLIKHMTECDTEDDLLCLLQKSVSSPLPDRAKHDIHVFLSQLKTKGYLV